MLMCSVSEETGIGNALNEETPAKIPACKNRRSPMLSSHLREKNSYSWREQPVSRYMSAGLALTANEHGR
jgi:hypothetical protein